MSTLTKLLLAILFAKLDSLLVCFLLQGGVSPHLIGNFGRGCHQAIGAAHVTARAAGVEGADVRST